MLIKAKERKTLVSACGGCRKPRNKRTVSLSVFLPLFLPPSLLRSFCVSPPPPAAVVDVPSRYSRLERVPGFLSCGSYDGFTTYRLFVVMRLLCSLVDRGYSTLRWTVLPATLPWPLVGDKKWRQVRNTESSADTIASRKPTGSLLRRAFDFESVVEDPTPRVLSRSIVFFFFFLFRLAR